MAGLLTEECDWMHSTRPRPPGFTVQCRHAHRERLFLPQKPLKTSLLFLYPQLYPSKVTRLYLPDYCTCHHSSCIYLETTALRSYLTKPCHLENKQSTLGHFRQNACLIGTCLMSYSFTKWAESSLSVGCR